MAQRLEGERAAADHAGRDLGQPEPGGPRAPVLERRTTTVDLWRMPRRRPVHAHLHLEHQGLVWLEVKPCNRAFVRAVLEDLPLDARCEQLHAVAGATDAEKVLVGDLEAGRHAPEVDAGENSITTLTSPSMHSDEVTASRRLEHTAVRDIEIVRHSKAGPPRLDHQCLADVALPERQPLGSGRIANEPAGGPPSSSANTAGESARGWHSQETRPSGVSRATVRWSESSVCRSIGGAESPSSHERRQLEQIGEEPGDGVGVGTRNRGGRVAGPTLMPTSGPASVAKRVLVGEVVADETPPRRSELLRMRVERGALVGRNGGDLDDLLAVLARHARLGRRDLRRSPRRRRPRRPRRPCGSGMPRSAGLRSTIAPGVRFAISSRCWITCVSRIADLVGEVWREPGLELGAVRPDEVHLGRQSAERGQVAQRPAGDRPRRGCRGAMRASANATIDSRWGRARAGSSTMGRDRAVVVARDEQDRRRDHVAERGRGAVGASGVSVSAETMCSACQDEASRNRFAQSKTVCCLTVVRNARMRRMTSSSGNERARRIAP